MKRAIKKSVEKKPVDEELVQKSKYNEDLDALIKIQKKIDRLVAKANAEIKKQ